MTEMARVMWNLPPTQCESGDGSWVANYTTANLPLHIALDEMRKGRCHILATTHGLFHCPDPDCWQCAGLPPFDNPQVEAPRALDAEDPWYCAFSIREEINLAHGKPDALTVEAIYEWADEICTHIDELRGVAAVAAIREDHQ